ncbi:MAG: DUF6119 family protein [Pleomorphochaeta sp.]
MSIYNGTKKHKIYLLDNDKIKETFFNIKNLSKDVPSKELIDLLKKKAKKTEYNYKTQALKEHVNTNGYNVEFLFGENENRNNQLKSFCKIFIDEGAKVCNFNTITFSSIMFIWENDNIFAVTTGQGFRFITPYIVTNFGMQIASKLNPSSLKVAAISSNSIDSNIHRKSFVYSHEVEFFNINELDSIYNEIVGRLYDKEEIKNIYDINGDKEKTSITILARDYIQFGSVADFYTLIKIIKKYDIPNIKSETDRFNMIKPLIKKTHESLITKNNNQLIKELYSNICNENLLIFDIFNRDVEAYIHADYYSIEFNSAILIDGDRIDKELIKKAYLNYLEFNQQEDSEDNFYLFVNEAKFNSSIEDKNGYVTTDSFLNHISGEIIVGEDNYYILYGKYYKLEASYIKRLTQSLENKILKSRYINEIETVWEKEFEEDDFNKKVAEGPTSDFIHLHKILINNIEFADLIKYDAKKEQFFIVHVKDGFNCSMRALERQVILSINLLNDIKNNDDFIKALYEKARSSSLEYVNKIETYFPTFKDFREKLILSDIVYIIAIKTNNRNLINSKSNIAKYCLLSLINTCLNNSIELKINFINTEE